MERMIRTNFHLTQKQRERLAAESARTGLTSAELIRRALDVVYRAKPIGPRKSGIVR